MAKPAPKSVTMEKLIALAKRRGFIYQGSEIYGGLAGTWDYGPLGLALKKNIAALWWKRFVDEREDMYGIETAILMNAKVWEASGHVTGFNDPLTECGHCQARYRVDQIPAVVAGKKLADAQCPNCGKTGTLSKPRQFNMMFETHIGPVTDEGSVTYLRPETAQGMFVNFKNIVDSFYPDLPFGIAQIGKAFRNEISPRDFIFRVRELEIMEFEYFVPTPDGQKYFEYWQGEMLAWFTRLGLPVDEVSVVEVAEGDRAHYSKQTADFHFNFPIGNQEIAGLAYRTDFDLANHAKHSKKSLEYIDKATGKSFVPHVVEPTFGLDRHVLAVIANAYREDAVAGESRVYLQLPAHLAPIKIAVSPLLKNKPELLKLARSVFEPLKANFGAVVWDDNGNIGKRYRRQDEVGTPFCVTIDFDSLEDKSVTVRDRDTTKQERVKIAKLAEYLSERLK